MMGAIVQSGGGASEPSIQASDIILSDVTDVTINFGWTSGNGAKRLVLMKAGSPIDSNPADNNSYVPDSNFGDGDEIGIGNFVIYNGAGNSVAVTGLSENTTYHIRIYEFNGNGGNENYLLSGVSGNPSSQLTFRTLYQNIIDFALAA